MKIRFCFLLPWIAVLLRASDLNDGHGVPMGRAAQVRAVAGAPEFHALRAKIAAGDASALVDLKALPIHDAELVLAGYLQTLGDSSQAAVAARRLIVQLPGSRSYYECLLQDNLEQRQGFEIGEIFKTMACIDSDVATRFLGSYLFCMTDFGEPAAGLERPLLLPREAAMQTLHWMKLRTSPTKKRRFIGGSADLRLWQNWWLEHRRDFSLNECLTFLSQSPKRAVFPAPSARLTIAAMPVSFTIPTVQLPQSVEMPRLELPPLAHLRPAPPVLSTKTPPPNWYPPTEAAVALLMTLVLYVQFRRKSRLRS